MHAPASVHIPRPALLAAIFVFNFIEFLSTGMTVFAAPAIMGHVGASPEEYATVSALYAAVAVLSISQLTVLLQRLGWRNYLLGAVLCYMLGAWLCATSGSVAAFAGGRLLMALGGGVFMTVSRMMVNLIPPSPQRLQGIAAFGGALSCGLALGPWAASAMLSHEAWGGMFLALAALATLGALIATRWLPQDAVTLDGSPSRMHVPDAVLLGLGAAVTLYALQHLTYDWHGERTPLMWHLALGVTLLAAFGVVHARRSDPFLHLRILKSPRYRLGLLIFSVCYAVLGMVNTLLPQVLQKGLGVGLEQAGELQGIGLLSTLVAFVSMLELVKRKPHPTKFYVTGFLMLALLAWRFATLDPRAHAWDAVTFWLGLFGAFLTLGMATTAIHSFKDLQADNVVFSNAQQLKNMLGQAGLALGVGLTNIGLQERSALHASRLGEKASALGDGGAALARQAGLLAGQDLFWIVMWVGLAGAVLLALQRRFD
ncbi:MFS transporter [Telluria beijingensis]|uniref:MFS transporter n=1 Tax=Telluria beijingensis TaxID=3068633 RepID=UPI002795F1CD|nr:MFS transporter [Massilia sp. REN29]